VSLDTLINFLDPTSLLVASDQPENLPPVNKLAIPPPIPFASLTKNALFLRSEKSPPPSPIIIDRVHF